MTSKNIFNQQKRRTITLHSDSSTFLIITLLFFVRSVVYSMFFSPSLLFLDQDNDRLSPKALAIRKRLDTCRSVSPFSTLAM